MGDRGNICVDNGPNQSPVYLYGHWSGSVMPHVVKRALDSERGRNRWDDGAYLTRIIFCELVSGDEKGETGYGIASHICDNQRPIIYVDPDKKIVGFSNEDTPRQPYVQWSFEDYCKLSEAAIDKAYNKDHDEG
jgi:hypothetical protein